MRDSRAPFVCVVLDRATLRLYMPPRGHLVDGLLRAPSCFGKDDQIFQNCDTLWWVLTKIPKRLDEFAIIPPAVRSLSLGLLIPSAIFHLAVGRTFCTGDVLLVKQFALLATE